MDAFETIRRKIPKEELADVSLIIDVLGLDISSGDIMEIQQAKLKRWLQRLGEGKDT